jgi:hypothetical protein
MLVVLALNTLEILMLSRCLIPPVRFRLCVFNYIYESKSLIDAHMFNQFLLILILIILFPEKEPSAPSG